MTMIDTFLKEMDQESETTRKMLSRIPDDKYDWRPHPKSMTVRSLATHIAELPTWVKTGLTTEELDFEASPYQPHVINNTRELMDYFEKSLKEGRGQLALAMDKDLEGKWVLRSGEQIHVSYTKGEVIRMTYCQIVHHRAQLGVFLRLLDIPIPGSYGPSADEMNF
jgi:uncharacterized damage-inducible protein DinB